MNQKTNAKVRKRRNAKRGPVMPPAVGVGSDSKILISPCLEICGRLQQKAKSLGSELMNDKYVKE